MPVQSYSGNEGKYVKKNDKSSRVEVASSLSDFLCFAVYSTNLAFNKAFKPLFDQLGLTYPQYVTLVALNEESDQTVGQLGEKMFLESSTLTPLLKRLEAAGYVTRRRDTRDERQVRISLTAQGQAIFDKAFCGRHAIIEATGLQPEAFARLQRDLIALRDNLLAASDRG